MLAMVMLLIGVGSSVGGGLATKHFDTKWGIRALRAEVHQYRKQTMAEIADLRKFVEDDNNIIKRDVKGIVRCMCKVDPNFKVAWQAYRAEVWQRENGMRQIRKKKKKAIEVENNEEV